MLDVNDPVQLNPGELKNLCFHGIPDDGNLRSVAWKVLLKYLPEQKRLWKSVLQEKRSFYYQLIDELVSPATSPKDVDGQRPETTSPPLPSEPAGDIAEGGDCTAKKERLAVSTSITPKDIEVLEQISKDVTRTLPDISFFQKPVETTNPHTASRPRGMSVFKIQGVQPSRVTSLTDHSNAYEPDGQSEYHWHAFERILYLYSKLNSYIGYVQGMNELLAPIYYTMATSSCKEDREYAEADSFFCFSNLMAEIRDNFMSSMDSDSATGIGASMKKFSDLIKLADSELWENLDSKKLCPEYYSFRWITLLLAQEFSLPDVLRIWDSLLADCNRFEFLLFVCCSMVLMQKDKLLSEGFGENLKLLQSYPPINVDELLYEAHVLRRGLLQPKFMGRLHSRRKSKGLEEMQVKIGTWGRQLFRHKKSPSNKT